MSDKIIVIGGGISGLTTALTLQLIGYNTEIITAKTIRNADKQTNPEFASLFPSASVIPHSVYSDQLEDLFILSQSIFYELRKLTFPGVTIHKHYEVFEFEPERPEYRSWMLNLQDIEDTEPEAIPRRPKIQELFGWVFDCIFADWELYQPAISELYKQSGGTITEQKLQQDDIAKFSTETIINCSGTGSPDLFEDPVGEQLIMRGHLLQKSSAPLITNAGDEIISYNYTPEASIYSDPEGNACDVYCYPREDGWVLGGSRQVGHLSAQDWNEISTPAYEIGDIKFPKQIIDLNREILEQTFGQKLTASDDLAASIGIRYIRDTKNGLRLDRVKKKGKTVIHNYGHGGAGVTLSWGCALNIATRISAQEQDEIKSTVLDGIEKELSKS